VADGTITVPITLAVVLGAGQGTRMGAGGNKMLLSLRGMPILARTVQAFVDTSEVDEILLVAHPNEVTLCEDLIMGRYGLTKVRAVIAGGPTRHQSEDRALAWLRPRVEAGEVGVILIHDGARPLVTPGEIAKVVEAASATGGAMLAGSVTADEKLLELGEDGCVVRTLPSSELVRAQTPQGFQARLLLEAYDAARAAGFEGTDTAASVERMGWPIAVVWGSGRNLKITTPDDLIRAEALLAGLT
jgi:2-C-methyl-D-erythritol 4-phosphate cytidylyltransferase